VIIRYSRFTLLLGLCLGELNDHFLQLI
jgi:hypothetical protein